MSLFKHTNASESGRLVEWFTDLKGNHEVILHILEGKPIKFITDFVGDANRQYEKFAAL